MQQRNPPRLLLQNVERPRKALTRRKALQAIGQVVYAVRFDDGTIKIGCTTDMSMRLRKLHSRDGQCEIVGLMLGDFDDEQRIHDTLVDHRAKGREFYHPHPDVLEVVNDMRRKVGQEPLAA